METLPRYIIELVTNRSVCAEAAYYRPDDGVQVWGCCHKVVDQPTDKGCTELSKHVFKGMYDN
jgi:hypothetical protein